MQVKTVYEKKRGCGYRKPSKNGAGLYLMSGSLIAPCGRLPFPLDVCPCCGAGIKFSRGFTWIDPSKLLAPELPPAPTCQPPCTVCNPNLVGDRAGLMWVGAKYYTPRSFALEANEVGISKKVNSIPNSFDIGKTFIYLAHKQAAYDWNDPKSPARPGIFSAFKPVRVDIVIADADKVPERALAIKEKLGERANIIVVKPGEPEQKELI